MAATKVVHIHLSSPTEWIQALSIPHSDIKRLTFSPLKWLRFATFAVCGARGHFSATPGGEMVDENVPLEDLAESYYYNTTDDYHLVDYLALDDNCTSSAATPRRTRFRDSVLSRNRGCIITGNVLESDAVHIIPMCKGSQYITWVLRDRACLYGELPLSLQGDIDINCAENGMMLRGDLHGMFGRGAIGFLSTPNFALALDDVPQIEPGAMPPNRTTLQYLEPTNDLYPVQPWDVRADWFCDGVSPPPSILLDFMYGAAVIKRWKCSGLDKMLEKRFKDDYSQVLAENPISPAPKDDEENGDEAEPDASDDPNDPSWRPWKGTQNKRKTFSSDASAGLLDAMDSLLLLSMFLKGNTPQSMAAESEKREKEKELRSQERSSEKVREWLNSDASTRPL